MFIENKDILNFDPGAKIIGQAKIKNLGFDLRNPEPYTATYVLNVTYLDKVLHNNFISAIFIPNDVFIQKEVQIHSSNKSIIICEKPKEYFFKFHNYLCLNNKYERAKFKSIIDPKAKIGKYASIAEYNVIIDANVIVEDFAVIRENVEIGANTLIQAGAVIGNSCIQCISDDDNNLMDILHIGGVKIGTNVKIESNSLVCRHIFNSSTIIGDNTKISGLSHITHGCKIGSNVVITPNAVILGSSIVENNVFIGSNATIAPMLTIGEGARITMGSVVTKDVLPKIHVTGNFAIPHDKFIQNQKKSI